MSQEIRRSKKRERERGMARDWSSQNTHIFVSLSHMGVVHGAPKQLQIVSKITHWSQITKTNIIIMRKSEILWELLNVTQRHKMSKCCWKNNANRFAWCRVAVKLQFVKNAISAKSNKVKCNKMKSDDTNFLCSVIDLFKDCFPEFHPHLLGIYFVCVLWSLYL